MIKIKNFVAEREVVARLNVEPPNLSAYADFVEAYWKGVTPERQPHEAAEFCSGLQEWVDREDKMGHAAFTTNYLARAPYFKPAAATPPEGWRLPETISREESWLIGEALASAYLRTLVDAWLETARDQNGRECPADRDIFKAPYAWDALAEFVEKCRPTMYPECSGFSLVIAAPEWGCPWAGDFFEAQWVSAKRVFVGIMGSDWCQRLCKCRYPPCGRYFIGAKLRQSYRHGTFCSPEHRARASADAITKARRSDENRGLVDAAAQWLAQRHCISAWSDSKALKRRVAEFLSEQVRRKPNLRDGRKPVRVNWVTRNRAVIEQRRQAALASS
jgi:hypothetical protein